MNLSVKKLRRSATVIGGTFLGLGIVTAMAAPALACHPAITPASACVNNDGTWVVNWSVSPSDGPDITGHVTGVVATPGTLTGIVGDQDDQPGTALPATGVQTLPATAQSAHIEITAVFDIGRKIVDTRSADIAKPSKQCDNQPPAPKPHPSTSHSTPAPKPEPQFVYDETCTTLTVGLELPKTWGKTETAIFTPNKGSAKSVTVKPGETKTVDFPASKGLTIKATAKGYEDQEPATLKYQAPKGCKTSTPAATPSTTPAALAITGSSSTPIAGGAIALLVLGGGAFFLARRRKMKFTA